MRKWLCIALAALLFVPALAEEFELDGEYEDYEAYEDYGEYEEYEDEEEKFVIDAGSAQQLELDEATYVDLDGDGADEVVVASMQINDEEEENLCVRVEADEQVYDYFSYIMYSGAAFVVDLDGDGSMEILLTGDEASADYFTWCLKFSREEGLKPIEFADANRGENTGAYFESGYGRISVIDGNTLELVGSQDALGTWMCSRRFALRDGRFELDDDGVWRVTEDLTDPENWEYRCLTTTQPLPVTLEDGSASTLPAGTSFLVTETDKQSFVGYQTRDGARGRIAVAPNTEDGWGFLIDGKNEYEYFEYVPYAD